MGCGSSSPNNAVADPAQPAPETASADVPSGKGGKRRRRTSVCSQQLDSQEFDDLTKEYEIGEELGSGTFATVYKAKSKKGGKDFAVKSIKKSELQVEELQALIKEVEVGKAINGQAHLVQMQEYYNTPDTLYIVQEYMDGGHLFNSIMEKKGYSETDARHIFKSIVTAVDGLHSKKIIHRDLKPDNILVTKGDNDVKLCDFGTCITVDDMAAGLDPAVHPPVGTLHFLSPEIVKQQHYSLPTDVFALGAILYMLLGGKPPFDDEEAIAKGDMLAILRLIREADVQFPGEVWDGISESAKDLLRAMLAVDPAQRPTCARILEHEWLAAEAAESAHLEATVATMKSWKARNRFRKAILASVIIQKFARGKSFSKAPAGAPLAEGVEKPAAGEAAPGHNSLKKDASILQAGMNVAKGGVKLPPLSQATSPAFGL